jgi:hypothetical protein
VRSSSASARGSPTRRTAIRGDCATRSSRTDGLIRSWGLQAPLRPALPSRRFLEQQSNEPPRGPAQQELGRQPEQQQRFPPRQHASMPEPERPRAIRERRGCVQGLA